MENLSDKINTIYNSSDEVKIEKVKRIKDGVTFFNYIWSVNGYSTPNWFGFNSLEECVDNCLDWVVINSL